jgi:hypothetical protein
MREFFLLPKDVWINLWISNFNACIIEIFFQIEKVLFWKICSFIFKNSSWIWVSGYLGWQGRFEHCASSTSKFGIPKGTYI